MQREKALPPFRPRVWIWITLACTVLLVVICRLHMLSFPLERDEGEYAYAGQIILQGVPPYSLACNMKLPGAYLIYALIMLVFPQTPAGIHLGLLFVNLASILLVFLLSRRLFDSGVAAASCTVFAFLSLSPYVLGLQAHATHFVVFFSLWGSLLLLKAIDTKRAGAVFLSGFLFGLAFLMKQQAAPIVLFGLVYLALSSRGWKASLRQAGLFSAGAAVPLAAVCLWLFASGVFPDFWFWTFRYAGQYVSEVPVQRAVTELVFRAVKAAGPYLWLWLLGIVGAFLPIRDRGNCRHPFFIAGLLFSAFLSVCPGFYFRPHYFITMLPALSVSAALCASEIYGVAKFTGSSVLRKLYFASAVALVVFTVIPNYNFFRLSPQEACRKVYKVNPFPEAVNVAEYIKADTRPGDKIAVIGSEPEIYFYSGRRSATGFIYTYSLVEKGNSYAPAMQRRFREEVTGARPEYLVFVHGFNSWYVPESAVMKALPWCESFCKKYYSPAGFVEIPFGKPARYCLKDGADCKNPASESYLCIYKRADHKDPAER